MRRFEDKPPYLPSLGVRKPRCGRVHCPQRAEIRKKDGCLFRTSFRVERCVTDQALAGLTLALRNTHMIALVGLVTDGNEGGWWGVDREGVWDSAFGVDGREVFAAIRIYAAEAV